VVRGAHARQRARQFNRRNPGFFPADVSLVNYMYAYAQHVVRNAIWRHFREEERRLLHGTGTGKPLGIINEKSCSSAIRKGGKK